ncbi:MAG: hypothetical protein IJ891_03585 [Prevotella sp.]|nr:hypothetical protein [Prevotella sp.]
MKTKYITPAVTSMRMVAEQTILDLSYGNQEGDGTQLSKEQNFFDVDSVLNKYVPDAFTNVYPPEE